MELRLLTNAAYAEEFDIIVDEITDQYVAGEFQGEDRERVEQYFLTAAERHNKLIFASTLVHYASVESDDQAVVTPQPYVPAHSTLFERARALWRNQTQALRVATAVAALVIISAVVVTVTRSPHPPTFVALALHLSSENRSEASQPKTVKLPPKNGGLRISMYLPNQSTPSSKYRVELVSEDGARRSLAIEKQDPQVVTVEVLASSITPGLYAAKLIAVNADGTEKPLNGSYFFRVE